MDIRMPCDLGEQIATQKGIKTITGVTFFKWSDGIEFTYYCAPENKWSSVYFFRKIIPVQKKSFVRVFLFSAQSLIISMSQIIERRKN